ncbi:hypothetical protein FQR65_LT16230 [Abscondita terminalis]|nr:hypothetical protein FQR65_LT16230 [Abscondita terminalis]
MDEASSDSSIEWVIPGRFEESETRRVIVHGRNLNKNISCSKKERVESDLVDGSEPREAPLPGLTDSQYRIVQKFIESIYKRGKNRVRHTERYTPTISSSVNRGDRSEVTMPLPTARTQNEETIMEYVDELIANDHEDIEREVEERFARNMENQRRAILNITTLHDEFDNIVIPEDPVQVLSVNVVPNDTTRAHTYEDVMVLSNNESDVEIVDAPCTSSNVTKTRKRRVGTCLKSAKKMRKVLVSTKIGPEPDTINPPVNQNSILGSRECSICLDQMQDKELSSTICGHVFCTPCIKAAVQSSKACPNCRLPQYFRRFFNTDLCPQHESFKNECRNFAETQLKPIAAKLDRDGKFPSEQINQMSDMGLLAINTSKKWHGLGLDKLSTALCVEELARCCGGTAAIISIHNCLYVNVIDRLGTDEQKEMFLKPFSRCIGCFALSEPDAGSDAANIQTTAVLNGNKYILNGTKCWVTSGLEGKAAVIFATVDKTLKHKGITAFLVPLPTPGLTISKVEDKLGIRASSTCTFVLKDVTVPKSNVLGGVGEGFKIAMTQFDEARIGIAAQALGIAQAALEASIQYASKRICFNRPIKDFQAVKMRIAEVACRVESSRLAVYKAAYLASSDKLSTKETSIAKLLASETATFAAHNAIQIFGGMGYVTDTPVGRFYRDARVTEIYGGVSDIQKLVIGEAIFKEYHR